MAKYNAVLAALQKIGLFTKIFLFNFEENALYGVFKPGGVSGMNLVKDIFDGKFPAQMKWTLETLYGCRAKMPYRAGELDETQVHILEGLLYANSHSHLLPRCVAANAASAAAAVAPAAPAVAPPAPASPPAAPAVAPPTAAPLPAPAAPPPAPVSQPATAVSAERILVLGERFLILHAVLVLLFAVLVLLFAWSVFARSECAGLNSF